MTSKIALAAVVTEGVLEEFELLRYSFELFHGNAYQWFLRCDEPVREYFQSNPNFHPKPFTERLAERIELDSADYRIVGSQKMLAMLDAWEFSSWEGAVYLDSDIVVAAPFIGELKAIPGGIVLTPHYYPTQRADWTLKYGRYNAGFAFSRVAEFPRWWRDAFLSDKMKFSDQQCLDEAPNLFKAGLTDKAFNIGFWRSAPPIDFEPIPPLAKFFHVHMFQPAKTANELIDEVFANEFAAATGRAKIRTPFNSYQLLNKTFAIHCLAFLKSSACEKHRSLYDTILERDRLGLYREILG